MDNSADVPQGLADAMPQGLESTLPLQDNAQIVAVYSIATNVKSKLPAIIIASLTLIAGLAWNDAFTAIVNYYVPEKYRDTNSAWIKLIYALIFTIVVIIIISIILYWVPIKNKL